MNDEFDVEYVSKLGISEAEPGYTCVRVVPNPSSYSFICGTVKLPIGDVSVLWEVRVDRFFLEVIIPTGIHLQVRLPAKPTDRLLIDGEPIADDTQTLRTDTFVDLAVLPGSRYVFEVIYGRLS